MEIGKPRRVIEIEPVSEPVPEHVPSEPSPDVAPAEPSPREPSRSEPVPGGRG